MPPKKIDLKISTCTESPECLLSDCVPFIALRKVFDDENSGFL